MRCVRDARPQRHADSTLAGAGLPVLWIRLPKFIGYSSVPQLGFSLALSHLALGRWLVAKGFAETRALVD